MRPITDEEIERIWNMPQAGVPVKRIARIMARQDVSLRMVISRSGGIRPKARVVNERHLSLAEREEISRGLAVGLSLRAIAQELGRAPSTICREVNANGGRRPAKQPSRPSGRHDTGPSGPRWPSSLGAAVSGPK